jgi:oligopeptide transport system substrate-binding protein
MICRLLIFMAVSGLAAGCRRETQVELGARGQVLHLGNGAEPKELDPATMQAEVEYTIDTALFEGLVNIANDGETILPGVAERWEVSPDGLHYTFHLRPDARWSDGSPLTAADFVYAFRRVFTPSLGCENNVYGYAIAGARAMNEGRGTDLGVKAPDAHTVEIQLEFRTPYLLYILAGAPFVPVPRAVVERFGGGAATGTAWTRPGNLVGNGPFVLATWQPNQVLVVTRNPRYWDRGRVRLREVRFYPTDNVEAEERSFRAGQLHVTYRLPISKLAAYRNRGDRQLHLTLQLDSLYLVCNVAKPPLNDVRVRRALALAIDRERIVPAVGRGALSPAHSLTRPGTAGYTPAALVDFDPLLARRLLAEAGFPDGRGFPVVRLQLGAGSNTALAEALQAGWRESLGVRVAIETQEQKTFFDALRVGNFQLGLMAFFYGVNAPETMLMVAQSGSNWNNTGWKSAAFDQAYRQANFAADEAARRASFDRMEGILHDEAPLIPIAFVNQPHLVSPMVRGWRDNAFYAIDWRELWLAP